MGKFAILVKRHRLAIGFAILTTVIVAFPQIYFRVDQKEIYQGIELLPDSPWSPRVREIQDDNTGFGSIYYKDGKGNPYLFQPLGSMTVGYMGRVFGLDINNTFLLSRFVLTFLSFILIYAFVLVLSGDRLVAISGALALLLADSVMSYYGIVEIFKGVSPDSFLRIARPVNPAMIYILFFGFLLSFWRFYRSKSWKDGILSVILLGLNFYNYFYSWTFIYAFGGVLVLVLAIQRKWREVLTLSYVFLGAILTLIPYAWNLYKASQHPSYEEASMRFGVVLTHAPLFIGFVALCALVVYVFSFPKEDKERYVFGLALLLTPLVTMNQQIITGKVLQAAHYHWFFHKPLAFIFVLVLAFYWVSKMGLDVYRKYLASALIIGSIFTGVFIQTNSYLYDMQDGGEVLVERQKYGPAIEWFNTYVERGSVVLANNEASHITVIYTPLDLFYHRAGLYSLAATKGRLLEQLFTFYRLRSVDALDARELFFNERAYISWNIYGMHYRELLGSYESIPDEEIEEIAALYKSTLSISMAKWLEQVLSKYEVEYLVWDKVEDPLWRLNQYSFLKEVAVFGDLAIYSFKLRR